MAEVRLVDIKKIYPNQGGTKKKKGDVPEKKHNLQITEEGVVAVQQFSLDIADREFIVLVGPSGCGKSTTLRMIAGLEEITEGELYIDGKRMNDVAPKDRDIAMVFQNYALYPHMTVYENMAFSPQAQEAPEEPRSTRRSARPRRSWTSPQYLDRKPKALSGGQRQRVAIGRAIVRKPARCSSWTSRSPTSTPSSATRCAPRSSSCATSIDTTFIYVTHDQTEAMTLGDRIVIMTRRLHPADRHAAGGVRPSRRTSSWPASSARRR